MDAKQQALYLSDPLLSQYCLAGTCYHQLIGHLRKDKHLARSDFRSAQLSLGVSDSFVLFHSCSLD